jgi:hypothetical protein
MFLLKNKILSLSVFAVVTFLFIQCGVAQQVQKVPAYPGPVKVVQPDGDTLRVRLFGDESFHYMTTEDGYFLVENDKGFYVYDKSGKKKLGQPSNVVANNPEKRDRREIRFLKKYEPKNMKK